MIARLRGAVAAIEEGALVVDVGGVGYLVFASARTLGLIERVGAEIALVIETHVREDHIHLYGFPSTAERDWFRLLTSVQGVGAKHGLSLMSALSVDDLQLAIAAQDSKALTRADGVGPKLAGRVVNELKGKAASIGLGSTLTPATAGPAGGGGEAPLADAISALVNLGYGRSEAARAVAAVARGLGEDATLDALITGALKELSA